MYAIWDKTEKKFAVTKRDYGEYFVTVESSEKMAYKRLSKYKNPKRYEIRPVELKVKEM